MGKTKSSTWRRRAMPSRLGWTRWRTSDYALRFKPTSAAAVEQTISCRRQDACTDRGPKSIHRLAVLRPREQQNRGRHVDGRPKDADEAERFLDPEDGIAPPKESRTTDIGGGRTRGVPVPHSAAPRAGGRAAPLPDTR